MNRNWTQQLTAAKGPSYQACFVYSLSCQQVVRIVMRPWGAKAISISYLLHKIQPVFFQMQGQETHYFDTLAQRRPNKPPITSILESPTSYLLCELTVDGRAAADCALCRDIIQSTCRVCLGNIGVGLATMNVVKQCSSSVFIVSVASSHLSEVWAAMTIASSFEKRGTSNFLPPSPAVFF